MTTTDRITRCRYCEQQHKPRYLCDPVRKILDAMYARGMEFNLPSVEFPEPIPASQLGLGLGPGDALVVQMVVQAATITVAGVARPLLIFTGRSAHGDTLPKWMYSGDDEDMGRLVGLVQSMADLARRRAAHERGEGT